MTTFPNSNLVGPAAGLVVAGVSHVYPVGKRFRRVLQDVHFHVPVGTVTALVGPSGCGKSTLLRVLAGLETPQAGSASMDGVRLDGKPGGVAYHPQEDALLPWLTVLDNATVAAETCGEPRASAQRRAVELLEEFGLTGYERAWPSELSGGMRQRVALLRTILMPKDVLVLDEPFGALDALTRRQMQNWLLHITAQDERPTVIVTHDIEEALLVADQVLVMSPRPAGIIYVENRPSVALRKRQRAMGTDHDAAERVLRALSAQDLDTVEQL